MKFGRRGFLQGLGAASAAAAFPHIWVPKSAYAQTAGRGIARHIIYIRLSGGFRFSAVFNGAVDAQFNPFGATSAKAQGTDWGVSTLLERATWLEGQAAQPRVDLGMKRVTDISNEICVLPCVDHEPFSARADGNHGTGLERFITGFVGGSTSFLTYLNYGMRAQVAEAAAQGITRLPAFSLGDASMSAGAGVFAAYRAPVLDGDGFTNFSFNAADSLPAWAKTIAGNADLRARDRLHEALKPSVEAYRQTRDATDAYGKIFRDRLLNVGNRSTELVDGISNQELEQIFGTGRTGRRAALALRLFHFGCPTVFMNEGGYDMHSGEEMNLPPAIDQLSRLISGFNAALKRMTHPAGGTYWDHTVVVFGSEFGRSTAGQRFNSAGGSDHSSDYATRWMSMPFMGGPIVAAGRGGRMLGQTRASDLKNLDKVYSYRAVLKSMLDWLGADHSQVFPADKPIEDFFS